MIKHVFSLIFSIIILININAFSADRDTTLVDEAPNTFTQHPVPRLTDNTIYDYCISPLTRSQFAALILFKILIQAPTDEGKQLIKTVSTGILSAVMDSANRINNFREYMQLMHYPHIPLLTLYYMNFLHLNG